MDFIGEKCVKCGNVFTADDDIVVCPECGSPHHRACYKTDNKCANEALHAEKKKWKRSEKIVEENVFDENAPVSICPVCKYPNEAGAEFCINCGSGLTDSEVSDDAPSENDEPQNSYADEVGIGISRPYLGFNPNEDLGGASLREVLHFVKSNTIYYIPLFKRMKDTGSKLSFNLLCFAFPQFYFANRRMWLWSMIVAAAMAILGTPAALKTVITESLNDTSNMMLSSGAVNILYNNRSALNNLVDVCLFAEIFIRLLMCLISNWMYFRHSVSSIKKLKKRYHGDITRECAASAGGTKPLNIVLVALISGAMKLGLLFMVFTILEAFVMFKNMM